MNARTRRSLFALFHLAMLAVLLLSLVPPTTQVAQAEPPDETTEDTTRQPLPPGTRRDRAGNVISQEEWQTEPAAVETELSDEAIELAQDCGVPARLSFGSDDEFLLAAFHDDGGSDYRSFRVDENPTGWRRTNLDGWWAWKSIDVDKLGVNELMIAMQGTDNNVWANIRTGQYGNTWKGWQNLSMKTESTPALVIPRPGYPVVLIRNIANQIQYKQPQGTGWSDATVIEGTENVVSGPVAVSMNMNHMAVFYLGSDGYVRISQYGGGTGGWSKPTTLKHQFKTDAQLEAISRTDGTIELAVIGADAGSETYNLRVYHWERGIKWDELEPTLVASNVLPRRKPALVSRHSNHLLIGYGSANHGSHELFYRSAKWEANDQNELVRTWLPEVSLGVAGTEVAVTVFDADTVMYLAKYLYEDRWYDIKIGADNTVKARSYFDNSNVVGGFSSPQGGLVPFLQANREILFFDRDAYPGHYLSWMPRSNGVAFKGLYGSHGTFPGGKAMGVARGDTRLLSLRTGGSGISSPYLHIIDASGRGFHWSSYMSTSHLGQAHKIARSDPFDMVADDLEGDANGEVIVANVHDGTLYVTAVELWDWGIARGETWTTRGGLDHAHDVEIATGDFDGDGNKEVVVAVLSSYRSIVLYKLAYGRTPHIHLRHLRTQQISPHGSEDLLSDFALTAGRFYDIRGTTAGKKAPRDQLVVATWFTDQKVFGQFSPWFRQHTLDVRVFPWHNPELSTPRRYYSTQYEDTGYRTIDIAMGQTDLDPTEEVVVTTPKSMYMLDKDTPDLNDPPSSMNRRIKSTVDPIGNGFSPHPTLALGDVDQDGLDEIAWSNTSRSLRIFDVLPDGSLFMTTSSDHAPDNSMVLVGDLDHDSFLGELAGCPEKFAEAKVVAVLFEPPRRDGQEAQATYGKYIEKTNATYEGARVSAGASIGVGTSFSQAAPFAGTTVFEMEVMATAEFSVDIGRGWGTEVSRNLEEEFTSDENEGGLVVTMIAGEYECFNYHLFRRSNRSDKRILTACGPQKPPIMYGYGLEQWYSDAVKASLGSTWVDIGRPTPEINYDMNLHGGTLIWEHNGEMSSGPGSVYSWSMGTSQGKTEVRDGSIGYNLVVSAEVATSGAKVAASAWAGAAYEWGFENSWNEGLNYGGSLSGSTHSYRFKPYVYQRDVKANSGAKYPITVLDYVVTSTSLASEPSATLAQMGPAPQPPVITSPTHPLEDTWYPTSTLTVEFEQPSAPYDPAPVAGYRWSLDDTPGRTPGGGMVATTVYSDSYLKDGLYYLNAQAVGEDGQYSPVSTRAVRIDTTAPQFEFAFDPPAPTGLGGWYTDVPVQVTAVVSDTADGSGIASFEYSTDDGATWQRVTGDSTPPMIYEDETDGETVRVRATDHAGLTTTGSTMLKIDTTAPSSADADGYGLSYGSITTNAMGNEVFVMGGVVNDSTSGRSIFNLRPGEQGVWESTIASDPVPMLPNNLFESSETSLNWVYTPTYQMRGFYNIYGQAIDLAGNTEEVEPMVEVLWEPEDTPDLSESQVILTSRETEEGEEQQVMTVKLYNSGFQESSVTAMNQLPDGVRAVSDTLSTGVGTASYDEATNQVVWEVPIIWPGTEQMLSFEVELTAAKAVTLENVLTLHPYWPGLDEDYPYDDLVIEDYLLDPVVITTVLTSKSSPALASDGAPTTTGATPELYHAGVWEGQIVTDPEVEIFLDASSDTSAFHLREWTWDTVNEQWELAQESRWVTFVPTATDELEVYEDETGRYGWYRWTLSPDDGVKYLSITIANVDGLESTREETHLIRTNLMSRGGQDLAAGEKVQYRLHLYPSDLAIFNLVEFAGDASVYVWEPRNGLHPDHESVSTEVNFAGVTIDLAGFFAQESGMYVVEVHGHEPGTSYRLVPAGDVESTQAVTAVVSSGGGNTTDERSLSAAEVDQLAAYEAALRGGTTAQELAATDRGVQLAAQMRPDHPDTLSTPWLAIEPPEDEEPNDPPQPGAEGKPVYLPLVVR